LTPSILKDDLIGPIFNGKIGDQWPNIWVSLLANDLTRSTYLFRQSFPHKQLPVAKEHFDRWMEISPLQQMSYLPVLERKKLNTRQEYGEMFKINYFRDADQKEIS
jgi:hemoglobin